VFSDDIAIVYMGLYRLTSKFNNSKQISTEAVAIKVSFLMMQFLYDVLWD